MACNCREDVPKKIKEVHGIDGKLNNYEFGKSYSALKHEQKKGKRVFKESTNILHTYCPYCGTKY